MYSWTKMFEALEDNINSISAGKGKYLAVYLQSYIQKYLLSNKQASKH